MRQQTERIGVALEMNQVGPFAVGEEGTELQPRSLAEEGGDGLFARMAERRIAQIVAQARRGHDVAYVVEDAVTVAVTLAQA